MKITQNVKFIKTMKIIRIVNIIKISVKCSKEWWQLANSLKDRVYVQAGTLNADDFAHFSSVLSDNDQQNVHWYIPYVVNEFLDTPV